MTVDELAQEFGVTFRVYAPGDLFPDVIPAGAIVAYREHEYVSAIAQGSNPDVWNDAAEPTLTDALASLLHTLESENQRKARYVVPETDQLLLKAEAFLRRLMREHPGSVAQDYGPPTPVTR